MCRQYDFYKEAFDEGKRAYWEHCQLKDNPYKAVGETLLYHAWQDGYVESQIEDEEFYE